MKLNVEIKPKEWILIAVFILLVYLTFSNRTQEAFEIVKYWFNK
jgi:hypothetical protein